MVLVYKMDGALKFCVAIYCMIFDRLTLSILFIEVVYLGMILEILALTVLVL